MLKFSVTTVDETTRVTPKEA